MENKIIRICDIVRNSVWFDPRVIKQIHEYDKAGFDLCIVGEEDERYNEEEISRMPGSVTIVPIKSKYKKFKNKFNTVLKEFSLYRGLVDAIVKYRPDIIHANDLDALLAAYLASRKLGCKVIFDSHEIYVDNIGFNSSFVKKILWAIVEKWIIKRVDLVVCVSNAAADFIAEKYGIKKPLVVTNCTRKQPESSVEPTKAGMFEVLNHGQFYEGRGYDLMVSAGAVTSNPDIAYVLRGFGKLESELRAEAESKQLTNVIFAPPVKTPELISAARKSHVGVAITLPICLNYKLSVSNKIFEYAAAGLPVIMSDIPEHRYLNEKYNFGIILKENTAECLRDAVTVLYENKELYKQYAANAKRLSEELNWETEFAKLMAAERQMMS